MIKFYCKYVYDTFLLVKPADVLHINNLFNNFDKNFRLLVDCFKNEVPRFLDIKVSLIKNSQFTQRTTTLVDTLIVIIILLVITKSVGFEVLLQEQNRYLV